MATDQQVQELVHRFEEGRWAKWVKLAALLTAMVGLYGAFILDPWGWGLYKGFAHPKAMEQAQIAREIARGHGFTTKMIRPLAYNQMRMKKGSVPTNKLPDTYHAPLWPATVAPFLWALEAFPEYVPGSLSPFRLPTFHAPTTDRLQMTTRDYIYVGDRMISAVALGFFFLSVMVSYLTVRRIFDHHVGIWTVALMLGCNLFWQFSLSGLPQMLMLFLFSSALYALLRATEIGARFLWPFGWLSLASLLFGLLALTHGIAAWIFAGAFVFSVAHFRPRWKTALLMGTIFLAVYSPWVYRNYKVCRSPFGVSAYTALEQVRGSENSIMRSQDLDLTGVSPTTFRRKVQSHLSLQMGTLLSDFGGLLAAPVFFMALLYYFKQPLPRTFRWALLLMWLCAALGMAVLAMNDEGTTLASNDLNVLFIPTFTAFGMAFILVMWTRLEISVRLVKYAFFALIFGLCSLPLWNYITLGGKGLQWPPYIPPGISLMREWTQPEEVIASDMPWAVAWYADRKSLWLPMTIQTFIDFNDWERMGGRVAGIYLTPISGNKALISDIVKGDYKEWAPFILRNVNIKDFPLKAVTAMPIDNQCIFYSDRDRWTDRMD